MIMYVPSVQTLKITFKFFISEIMIVLINLNSYVTPPNIFIERKVVNSDAELHRLLKGLKDLFDAFDMQGNCICLF